MLDFFYFFIPHNIFLDLYHTLIPKRLGMLLRTFIFLAPFASEKMQSLEYRNVGYKIYYDTPTKRLVEKQVSLTSLGWEKSKNLVNIYVFKIVLRKYTFLDISQ